MSGWKMTLPPIDSGVPDRCNRASLPLENRGGQSRYSRYSSPSSQGEDSIRSRNRSSMIGLTAPTGAAGICAHLLERDFMQARMSLKTRTGHLVRIRCCKETLSPCNQSGAPALFHGKTSASAGQTVSLVADRWMVEPSTQKIGFLPFLVEHCVELLGSFAAA